MTATQIHQWARSWNSDSLKSLWSFVFASVVGSIVRFIVNECCTVYVLGACFTSDQLDEKKKDKLEWNTMWDFDFEQFLFRKWTTLMDLQWPRPDFTHYSVIFDCAFWIIHKLSWGIECWAIKICEEGTVHESQMFMLERNRAAGTIELRTNKIRRKKKSGVITIEGEKNLL